MAKKIKKKQQNILTDRSRDLFDIYKNARQ